MYCVVIAVTMPSNIMDGFGKFWSICHALLENYVFQVRKFNSVCDFAFNRVLI